MPWKEEWSIVDQISAYKVIVNEILFDEKRVEDKKKMGSPSITMANRVGKKYSLIKKTPILFFTS